ncbi:MAG TPA: presenilin family intramembrane aspartyl protease PSH [Candidatus Thermoplasmatota archaeon]|nr:presenilin family intramembrane aspartyl protease PSH [Candidatus Thermoplasmatota archaeon]
MAPSTRRVVPSDPGGPDAAPAAATPAAPLPVTAAELRAAAALLLLFVANFLLAIVFAQPFFDAGLQAFKDPENVGNSVGYLVLVLAFTFLILYIAKKGKKWLIRAIILGAVASTVGYVVYPVLYITLGWTSGAALGVALAAAAAATIALAVHPEWYVIDAVGLLVAAGAASVFGISLGILPVIVLLVLLAVYDAIAVYKTKHMLSLADSVIELRLPVLLVIPKVMGYSFRREATRMRDASADTKGEREAMFMGLGDLVMPTILVVSALHFAEPGWGSLPSLGAALGTLVGYGILMSFVLKGNPQAGLPLLNGGAILGFLVGLYAATGSVAFW